MGFSLELLEFISIHSLNVAPNSTAWAETLEAFWARKDTLQRLKVCRVILDRYSPLIANAHQGHLRKRLAMALTWYQVLENRAEVYVTHQLGGECLCTVAGYWTDEKCVGKAGSDSKTTLVTDEGRPSKRARIVKTEQEDDDVGQIDAVTLWLTMI